MTKSKTKQTPISLASAFVKRAGVPEEYVQQCLAVEKLLSERKFTGVRKAMYSLYVSLLDKVQGDIPFNQEDAPVVNFWNQKVAQLIIGLPKQGLVLSVDCLKAIEDRQVQSEEVRISAYSAAIAASRVMLSVDPDCRDQVCGVLKNVMTQVSEFVTCTVTQRAFDEAADEFNRVLLLYPSFVRYDQVTQLSDLLKSREVDSPYLAAYVERTLAVAGEYENGVRYIPDMPEDVSPPLSHLKLVYSKEPS